MIAKVLHNPGAGNEEHSKKELISLLETYGIECRYSSTKKKDWEKIDADTDFLVIAGGDGTVRKVADELLDRKLIDKKLPIALLPLGTANNIAGTLGIGGEPADIIISWSRHHIRKYDVGRVEGIPGVKFMLEGMGYGVFPQLMKTMKSLDKALVDTPEKKMRMALEQLHRIILSFEACYCHIEVNGADHSGRYLMAEIMNGRSIGPNLQLAPMADPGDGEMEVVLVPENQREALAVHIQNKISSIETPFPVNPLKATRVITHCANNLLHVDDEMIEMKEPEDINMVVQEGRLEFLVP